jgi:alcohol-forming fatty acyl-CoA reductase
MAKVEKMKKLNFVQQFYAGKTIFITGGSGFMGKVLIEKLLYSCSEVKELIILMRPKRGKSASHRVEDFIKLPVRLAREFSLKHIMKSLTLKHLLS